MKKQTLALFTVALAVGSIAVGQAQPAAASPAPATQPAAASASPTHIPTKVGVIQIQAAIISTKDGQKATQEFQSKLEPRKKELDRKAGEIRELQDKLQRGGNAMAESAKTDLTRTIDAKTKSYNRDMEDAQAEAQAEERKMLEELSGKMQVVIEKYAQANAFTVLLDVSNQNTNVIWISTAIDVTKDVIDLYDKMNPGSPGAKPTSMPTSKPAAPATAPVTKPAPPSTPPATPPVTPKKQP